MDWELIRITAGLTSSLYTKKCKNCFNTLICAEIDKYCPVCGGNEFTGYRKNISVAMSADVPKDLGLICSACNSRIYTAVDDDPYEAAITCYCPVCRDDEIIVDEDLQTQDTIVREKELKMENRLAGKRFRIARKLYNLTQASIFDFNDFMKRVGVTDITTIGSWENKGIPDNKIQSVADLFSIKSYYLIDPDIDDDQFRYLVLLHKDADIQNLTSIFDDITKFIDNNEIESIVMSGNVIPEKFDVINDSYSEFKNMFPNLPPYITESVEHIFNNLQENINKLVNVLEQIIENRDRGIKDTAEDLRSVNDQVIKIKKEFKTDLQSLFFNRLPTEND
jgi:transcriptional regulator with XRE-family HTH domain